MFNWAKDCLRRLDLMGKTASTAVEFKHEDLIMFFRTLSSFDLTAKRVLVRVDINVPLRDGRVSDSTRIDKIVPTVNAILEGGGTPILLAHFGRPKGKRVPDMSLGQIAPKVEEVLGHHVCFVAETVGPAAQTAIETAPQGTVVLLENTRFHPQEEANDPAFAAQLAKLGDIFCNDAFSAAHRAHASTEGLAHHLPSCAGHLMAAELEALARALENPARPVTAVVGGAKVSTKLDLLANLIEKVDHLIIGGGMANTFLYAMGHEIGGSLAENDLALTAQKVLAKAKARGCALHLPLDVVVAQAFEADAEHGLHSAEACPSEGMILDAGPKTVAAIEAVFAQSATVLWNGPLGAFELAPFDAATVAAARAAAALTRKGVLLSVAGGGDTVAALNHAGVAGDFSYISTAGGAFLEYIEGKTLPGVAALMSGN